MFGGVSDFDELVMIEVGASLCTNVIFIFSQLILEASAKKRKRKRKKRKKKLVPVP